MLFQCDRDTAIAAVYSNTSKHIHMIQLIGIGKGEAGGAEAPQLQNQGANLPWFALKTMYTITF